MRCILHTRNCRDKVSLHIICLIKFAVNVVTIAVVSCSLRCPVCKVAIMRYETRSAFPLMMMIRNENDLHYKCSRFPLNDSTGVGRRNLPLTYIYTLFVPRQIDDNVAIVENVRSLSNVVTNYSTAGDV